MFEEIGSPTLRHFSLRSARIDRLLLKYNSLSLLMPYIKLLSHMKIAIERPSYTLYKSRIILQAAEFLLHIWVLTLRPDRY